MWSGELWRAAHRPASKGAQRSSEGRWWERWPAGDGRVVLAIFISPCVAFYETVLRLLNPQELEHLWVLAGAGLIGYVGNDRMTSA